MSSTSQREITSRAVKRTPGQDLDVEGIDLHQVTGALDAVAVGLAYGVRTAQVPATGQHPAADLLAQSVEA